MKYDCSDEFDLNLIYKKLTDSRNQYTVKACDFFDRKDELKLLQIKMDKIMLAQRKIKTR